MPSSWTRPSFFFLMRAPFSAALSGAAGGASHDDVREFRPVFSLRKLCPCPVRLEATAALNVSTAYGLLSGLCAHVQSFAIAKAFAVPTA